MFSSKICFAATIVFPFDLVSPSNMLIALAVSSTFCCVVFLSLFVCCAGCCVSVGDRFDFAALVLRVVAPSCVSILLDRAACFLFPVDSSRVSSSHRKRRKVERSFYP